VSGVKTEFRIIYSANFMLYIHPIQTKQKLVLQVAVKNNYMKIIRLTPLDTSSSFT